MASTLNKKEKIADLIKNWEEYKKMTHEEIGAKLGVSGKTIYLWRKKLELRGIKLVANPPTPKMDNDLFDSFVK